MLYPSLQLLAGETPASFVSRLAMLHRKRSARSFSLDMGFRFQAIVDGDPDALQSLATLVEQPADHLGVAAIRREAGTFHLKGQDLVRSSLRRARVTVCPRCIAEDIACKPLPWMAGGRTNWLLASIRTCMHHHVPLVEVAHTNYASVIHDFAQNVAPALADIPRLAQEAVECAPTAMESYLIGRLEGESGPTWLDTLPWYAAARTCEMIGSIAEFGPKAPIRSFGDPEWRRAGDAGFEIAARGYQGIRAFLEDMRRDYPESRSDPTGPQAWFGRLHIWLAGANTDRVYDPLRSIIIDIGRDKEPIGPEDSVFGCQIVERRRLHSLRTAAQETGLHPKRLRRILAVMGIIPADHRKLSDDRIIFEADRAEDALARAKRAMNHKQAETYLNAGRSHTLLLAKHGYIRPFASSGEESLKDHAYDKAELDSFLAILLADTVPLNTFEPPIHTIAQAARRANCGAVEILQLILNKRLSWVGRNANDYGYASVLINLDEIKRLVRGDRGGDLTRRQVETRLRTSTRVVDALINAEILSMRKAISPLNRCPYIAVPASAVDAFTTEYVSLHEIARNLRVDFKLVKKRLMAKGIQPALNRDLIPALFYRRRDIPAEL